VDDQAFPVLGANLDVVGIVGPFTPTDVDGEGNSDAFPFDTPVLVFSNDTVAIGKLGTAGFVMDAVNGINDQLSDYQVAAQLVIVRTRYGTSETESIQLQQTIAAVMGSSTTGTGLWALLKAPSLLFCTPRLILAPGYTGQMANSLDSFDVGTPGIGYTPGQTYTITFSNGPDETNGAQLVLPAGHAIAASDGTIGQDQIVIDSHGAWMTDEPNAVLPVPDVESIDAAYAEGALIFSAQPGVGSTITMKNSVLEFVTSPAAGAVPSAAHLAGGDTGVSATGNILFHYNPAPGDTITLGGVAVTFVASGAAGLQVNIGISLAATMDALKTMLNASGDSVIDTVTYDVTGTPHDTLTLSVDATGAGGNSFALLVNVTTLEILLGANLSATLANLMTYLSTSRNADVALCTYVLHAGTVSIVYKTTGSAGNSFTLGTTVFGLSLSGNSLSGGHAAGTPTRALMTTVIAMGANPVCAALTPVLDALMGHAVVESSGVSAVDDELWRDTLSSPRLIALSGGVKIVDPVSGDVIVMPYAPRQVGLMIAEDYSTGFPFHSAANRAVQGIVGPGRTISFSLTDGACEGQMLLSNNIGIIARGLIGVETAIAAGGFVSIATDTLASDPLWQFYNVTRGRDFIELSLMPALRTYLGRSNITAQTVTNILSTISGFLSNLKALQQIIDFRVNFLGALNSAAEIRKGHLTVGFQAEEPPVLRMITTMSARYAPAIDAMVAQLESQLNLTA
jgi:phage tail sheath protein FI